MIAAAIAFTSTAAFLWDEVIGAKRPKLLNVLLFLPWYWWTIGLLVLLVVLIQQYAYKLIHALEESVEGVESRSRNVGVRDWIGEWGESERQFRKWEMSDVFAERFHSTWSIRSDNMPVAREEVEVACRLAGSRLFHSPGIVMSEKVRSQPEHGLRWLYFLEETEGFTGTVRVAFDHGGYIQKLARVSALTCIKCAAKAYD